MSSMCCLAPRLVSSRRGEKPKEQSRSPSSDGDGTKKLLCSGYWKKSIQKNPKRFFRKSVSILLFNLSRPQMYQMRSHTRDSDMQSGSLTAILDMLSSTQCGHEMRSLRSWNTSLQTWAHLEHLSQTGHKSKNHGLSTRCVARMAFGRSTQRLTLHWRMAKISDTPRWNPVICTLLKIDAVSNNWIVHYSKLMQWILIEMNIGLTQMKLLAIYLLLFTGHSMCQKKYNSVHCLAGTCQVCYLFWPQSFHRLSVSQSAGRRSTI